MTITIISLNQDELFDHQVNQYTSRLKAERQKPDSDHKTKAIAFLREQLSKIKQAHRERNY